VQNDRTSIEKAVLTFGTIWFKLKPISRERSDRLVFSLLARSGVIFTRKKKFGNCCNFASFGPFGYVLNTECLLDLY
jgi:hypothetical protein